MIGVQSLVKTPQPGVRVLLSGCGAFVVVSLILLVPERVMLSQICTQVGEGEIYLSTPRLNKNVLVKQTAAVGVGILGSHTHGLGDVRSRGEPGESS
mgnify:FL=1